MTMDLSTLRPAEGATKARKRVGRGPSSGHGKTSTKGHKGAQARSGYSRRIGFEGGQNPLHRRLPKRGFNHTKRMPVSVINVDVLDGAFEAGAEITAEVLVKRGLAKKLAGGVKLLGRGETSKAFTVRVQGVSPSAQTKIEAAGGTVEIIGGAPAPAESQGE